MQSLLKPKSKSLMLSQPLSQQLKNHIAMVQVRGLEEMKDKLSKQIQKQQRLNTIQRQFIQWAEKQELRTRQKLQKSAKIKDQNINKIVNKCKNHQKYIGQKMKLYQTKRKRNLKQAWKKMQQFNQNFSSKNTHYATSKPLSHYRAAVKVKTDNQIVDSRVYISSDFANKRQANQYLNISFQNNPRYQKKQANNLTKDQGLTNKMNQTYARFQTFLQQDNKNKIQQLGETFQRIQKSRLRRKSLNSKKHFQRHPNLQTEEDQGKRTKPKPKRSLRANSEHCFLQKRLNDWSEANRQKREQMFLTHLQNGTFYLQQGKNKYLKANLTKKVAMSVVQQKLYFERLKH